MKNVLKVISVLSIVLFIAACDDTPPVVFDEPIPGLKIDLSKKIGNSFTIGAAGDSVTINIDYDKKTKINYIIAESDTLFVGTITKRNEMFLLNKKLENGSYAISAIRFTDSSVTGLGDARKQAQLIKAEIEKGKYEKLILDTNERITMHARIRDGKDIFRMVLDQLEPLPLVKNDGKFIIELEKVVAEETTSVEKVNDNFEKELISKIFPNPIVDFVNLELNISGSSKLIIFNQNGQVVKSQDLNGNSIQLNLSELETGTYILEVSDGESGKVERKKLMKN